MAKETIIIQLRPKYEELKAYRFPVDKMKSFLLSFAKILVPKWPEESLNEIINNIVK